MQNKGIFCQNILKKNCLTYREGSQKITCYEDTSEYNVWDNEKTSSENFNQTLGRFINGVVIFI